jgi:uncharacterized protein
MNSSPIDDRRRIVVDPIHGDIELDNEEWRIVDTASFQRLRFIKQLAMGHLVYPNATHTRFAHSLGVFGIMRRILDTAKRNRIDLSDERIKDLRVAALVHDVGHYPYSHLLEGVDRVQLIEEFVHNPGRAKKTLKSVTPYPNHVRLGQLVVTHQTDLLDAIGGSARAQVITDLFGRTEAADPQWSKLINSSFDMDRLDYLLRDSQAAGVAYGAIDLDYLLNSLRISPGGLLGVDEKALPAAEQYLLARYFMHRTVYWHKTTYAFEEVARQLIRRIRDQRPGKYNLPADGHAVEELVKTAKLRTFTDGYLDALFDAAGGDSDEVVRTFAKCLIDRRPPKLLREVCELQKPGKVGARGTAFKKDCKHRLKDLAAANKVPLWRFLFGETQPLRLEKRGPEVSAQTARNLEPEEADDLIKVFCNGEAEPVSLVDIEHSIIHRCADSMVQLYRLYVIDDGCTDESQYDKLRESVRKWETD